MSISDYEAAWLACAVYYAKDEEAYKKYLPSGWKETERQEKDEHGFLCVLYTKRSSSDSGNTSLFSIMGTSSTAGKEIAKGQLKSNAELRQDPEDKSLGIVDDAIEFVKTQISKLDQDGGNWKHNIAGHSLGGFTASCTTVALSDKLDRCITFESPGVSKYWRDKAKSKGEDAWKEQITDYVSFPNPINTCLPHIGSLYRLHMQCQSSSSPGHVIRCAVGSSLRFIVWVSVANLAFASVGKAKGFWAAKVGSVTVKMFKLLFARQFTPKRIKTAFKEGLKDDQASKDTRKAEKEGKVDDPGAQPLKPVLKVIPEKARPAFIVGFWAVFTAAFSNTGYVSMRSLAQINDCMAEHNVDSIAEHFVKETGDAKGKTEMESWPYHEIMIKGGLVSEHVRRCYLEGLTPFHSTAYGMHNLLQREKVLLRRACTMPGFKEA